MNKERLGFDIEIEMKHLKKILNKDDSLTISSRFVKYLIEQAERAQELESDYEHLESIIDRVYFDRAREISRANELDRQNNRYREALERIAYDDELLSNTDDIIVAKEALEE